MEDDYTVGNHGAGPCRDCGLYSPGRWPGQRCWPCWGLQVAARRERVNAGPTALYHCYDTAGNLLYIGTSIEPDRRWKEHRTVMPWWPDAVRIDIDWMDRGASEMRWVEINAIRAELPWYNKSGYEDDPRGERYTAAIPDGCPPQPWTLDFEDKASYRRHWAEWRAIFRDFHLNPEERAARGQLPAGPPDLSQLPGILGA